MAPKAQPVRASDSAGPKCGGINKNQKKAAKKAFKAIKQLPADPLERFNALHQRLGFKPNVEIIEEKRFKVMISVAGRQVEGAVHGEKKDAKISAVGEINPYLEGLLVAKANAVTAPAEAQGLGKEQNDAMVEDGQDKSEPDAVGGAWKADDLDDILDWDLDDEVP